MATENIVKNQFYRILKDKTNDIWDRISYWTHADDVEMSDGTTLSANITAKDTKITNLFGDFAPTESSSVSSQAYIKGQCLVYNNQFYRVIAPIAVGNTLTVGTNIQVMTAGEVSTMLTANTGEGFYFDVKDGAYGFYPSASKTASEFVPFGGTSLSKFTAAVSYRNSSGTDIMYCDGTGVVQSKPSYYVNTPFESALVTISHGSGSITTVTFKVDCEVIGYNGTTNISGHKNAGESFQTHVLSSTFNMIAYAS